VPARQLRERRLLARAARRRTQRQRGGTRHAEDRVGPGGVEPGPEVVLVGREREPVHTVDRFERTDIERQLAGRDPGPELAAEAGDDVHASDGARRIADRAETVAELVEIAVHVKLQMVMSAGADGE